MGWSLYVLTLCTFGGDVITTATANLAAGAAANMLDNNDNEIQLPHFKEILLVPLPLVSSFVQPMACHGGDVRGKALSERGGGWELEWRLLDSGWGMWSMEYYYYNF